MAIGESELNPIGEYVQHHLPDWMERLAPPVAMPVHRRTCRGVPRPAGTDVIVSGSLEDNGPWIVRLKPGDDENAAYSMWRYHATLIRVVDGDTFDARVNLRFSVTIDERFRLEAIAAPEIFGVDHEQPEYARGVAAKAFLEERFRANGGSMILHSSRRGKWRRWLAWVFAPAGQKVLNVQLLDAGLADYAPAGRPRNTRKVNSRISVTLEPDLRARLTERAEATDQTPREVVHVADRSGSCPPSHPTIRIPAAQPLTPIDRVVTVIT